MLNFEVKLQRHFIANHLKFKLNCIRYLFLLSFPRKRESRLFLDISGVLDARGHDVKSDAAVLKAEAKGGVL